MKFIYLTCELWISYEFQICNRYLHCRTDAGRAVRKKVSICLADENCKSLYLCARLPRILFTRIFCFVEDSDSCDETIPPSVDLINSTDKAVSKTEKKKSSFEDILTHWPADVAGSHIWDQSVRREVKETKMSEQELNRRRSELLVPSSHLDLNPDEISHIPVLLIQQPGCSG